MMQLVGRTMSPFVRRVAATLNLYGLPWQAVPLATATDGAKISAYNPVGRVPALVLEDGEVLLDSAAILDALDERMGGAALTPRAGAERRAVLRAVAIATGAAEKAVQAYYETTRRPEALRWAEGVAAVEAQVAGGLAALEAMAGGEHLCGGAMTQADVTAVAVFDFIGRVRPALLDGRYPGLAALSMRLNADPRIGDTRPPG